MRSHSHGDRIRSSEARILQKLNELQLEFQEGKRAAPAFSLVTVETLDQEETWQNIVTELQTKDIDTQAISTNQGYIRNWIDQVILADDDASAGKFFRACTQPFGSSCEIILYRRAMFQFFTSAVLFLDEGSELINLGR